MTPVLLLDDWLDELADDAELLDWLEDDELTSSKNGRATSGRATSGRATSGTASHCTNHVTIGSLSLPDPRHLRRKLL